MADLHIYTDGSCEPNPGPGGWAFVAYEGDREVATGFAGESGTTNNRMEMTAVLQAIRWLDGRPAHILSDSQYVVKGINEWTLGWKRRGWKRKGDGGTLVDVLNVDLWMTIDAERMPGQQLHWVRGHNGLAGNERADELAEIARISVPETRNVALIRR